MNYFDTFHGLLPVLQKHLFTSLYNNELKISRTTLRNLIIENNGLHGDPHVMGAIMYQGEKYFAGYPADEYRIHYSIHEDLMGRFLAYRKKEKDLNYETKKTKRLLATLFNTQPNLHQLQEALGNTLVNQMLDALSPKARANVVHKLEQRVPPSPTFAEFLSANRQYFHMLQQRVIKNMLLGKKSN
jgi:hypothetical protein